MKISLRLALYYIVITAVAIVACSGILLYTTARNHINSTIDNGIAELRMLDHSFNAEISVVAEKNMSDAVQRSLILYVFRKYTSASISGAHYVLSDTQDTLYNDSPINPLPLLQDLKESYDIKESSGVLPNTIVELDGRRYLAVGRWSNGLGEKIDWKHELYLVRDVSAVYENIAVLGGRFALIAVVTIITSAIVMVFFIRCALTPLTALQKSAFALANGQYDNRIDVHGHDEISELAASFNKMADAIARHIEVLEDTAEQRKLLLSMLTHELKTPMTAIIGYSESLLCINLNPEQKEEAITYINKECKRVERLAQKMMQLVTLHDGEALSICPRPVTALYAAVQNTLEEVAKRERIRLVFESQEDFIINMDLDMMASVMINLFDNARKAGAKHITIIAENNCISVIDDGAGIPEGEIKNIMQPFYMVDKSHSHSIGGSGLGLALCNLIIKAHQARISIKSQLGTGTTISILFRNI